MAKIKFEFRARWSLHGEGDAGQGPQDLGGYSKAAAAHHQGVQRAMDRPQTHTKLDLPNKPPRENQILNAGLGDVIYACEWSDRDVTGFEAIGWFHGTETVRDWRGKSRVNLFARVDQSGWPFLEEVGLRTSARGRRGLHDYLGEGIIHSGVFLLSTDDIEISTSPPSSSLDTFADPRHQPRLVIRLIDDFGRQHYLVRQRFVLEIAERRSNPFFLWARDGLPRFAGNGDLNYSHRISLRYSRSVNSGVAGPW